VEREFVRRLRDAGVATTVRDTRGREIDGACGQLAASEVTVADAGGVTADTEVAR
jgi:23S rRNA (adenine2503-C2)-methyltransferase